MWVWFVAPTARPFVVPRRAAELAHRRTELVAPVRSVHDEAAHHQPDERTDTGKGDHERRHRTNALMVSFNTKGLSAGPLM
jgi:hypothetical protein